VVISASVAVLGRRKLAREKQGVSSWFVATADLDSVVLVWRSRMGSVLARCMEPPRMWRRVRRLPGRAIDGGSEARESRIPAILRRSLPKICRRAKITGRLVDWY
jgi:hypothetical protein